MQTVLAVVSILMIISVFLSRIRNDFWIYKILEYPRMQKLAIIIIVFAMWGFYWPPESLFYKILIGALGLSVIYLIYRIFPYSKLAKKEMVRAKSKDPDNELSIYTANVFQDNTDYARMLQQIKQADADLVFLLETDHKWAAAIQELERMYPYSLLEPIDNTYGLLFYSRFKILEGNVRYLVKNDIPSIAAVIALPSGEKVQLWGIHPEPPVPGESLYSTAKDKELMKIALEAKDCRLPSLAFGDLNDVAWSHTTELFRKTSNMLDPRRGRGLYNTFSAYNWFIRFPLDYIFCSKEFALINMQRMKKNGSDHFAMLTRLALRKDLVHKQDVPEADSKEISEAKEMAQQAV